MTTPAFQFRQDIDMIKTQLEETVKMQLDLFYEQRLAPSQSRLIEYSDRIKELEIEKISTTDEISKVKHYNELLNEKIVSLQEEIASFSKVSQVVKLQNKNAELQTKLNEMELLVSKLQKENNELHRTNAQLNHKIEGVMKEASQQTLTVKKESYLLRFDGASRGNPGLASAGYICYLNDDKNKTILYKGGDFLGENETNNVAEYSGLLFGLNHFIENTTEKEAGTLHVEGDSQMIIDQMNGTKKVKAEHLIPFYELCVEKLEVLKKKGWVIYFSHVTRDKNTVADKLCNDAIDIYLSEQKPVEPVVVAVVSTPPVTVEEHKESEPVATMVLTQPVTVEEQKPVEPVATRVSTQPVTVEEQKPVEPVATLVSTPPVTVEEHKESEPVATVNSLPENSSIPPTTTATIQSVPNIATITPTPTTAEEPEHKEENHPLVESEKIKYTLKKIKGIEYFIGSDNFLYAKNEDGTVGNKVGQKSGERAYKFFK